MACKLKMGRNKVRVNTTKCCYSTYVQLSSYVPFTQSLECVVSTKLQKMSDKDSALCFAQPPELLQVTPNYNYIYDEVLREREERWERLLRKVRQGKKSKHSIQVD